MTLLDLIKSIKKRWRIVAASVLVCTLISGIVAFLTTPTYRALTVLAPAVDIGPNARLAEQLTGIASLVGVDGDPQVAATNEAVAILQSRAFIDRFIQEQNLLPVLDAAQGGFLASLFGDSDYSAQRAYQNFVDHVLSIRQDRNTGMYILNIDWHEPERAAAWANLLVERLNNETRNATIDRAEKQIGYLNAELNKATVLGTREAIFRLLENEIRTAMIASAQRDYAFRVIDPAVAPEPGYFRWPRRGLMIFAGAVLGLALGSLFAAMRSAASQIASQT